MEIPFASTLSCENFTAQKFEDCSEIIGSDLTEDEKLTLLDILEDEEYVDALIEPEIKKEPIGLYLRTDKPSYKVDEIIKVDIFPKGILVSIKYGDEIRFAKDSTSFKAKADFNRIAIQKDGESFERVFTLINYNRLLLVWKVALLLVVNYFIFSCLTKPSFIRKWLPAV